MPEAAWDLVQDVNLKGTFLCTQAFGRIRLRAGGGGAIVNLASTAAFSARIGASHYSASKAGVVMFTKSAAQELGPHAIRVNAVAPGPIWTPLNPCGGTPADDMKDFGKDTPMGRPGQPNEVAPCFLFLACEDSSYMSGQVMHPNGGTIVGS